MAAGAEIATIGERRTELSECHLHRSAFVDRRKLLQLIDQREVAV
jgi:hypothetical protein